MMTITVNDDGLAQRQHEGLCRTEQMFVLRPRSTTLVNKITT